MKMCEGKFVVTMDKEGTIIHNGAVVTDEDKILAVGKKDDLQRNYQVDEKMGGEDFVVIPGLVNTHFHSEVSFFRGLCDNMSLMEFKRQVLTPAISHYTPEDVYLASLVSLIELVKNGITTVLDIGVGKRQSAEAASKIGMRSVVAEAMMDRVLGESEGPVESTEKALQRSLNLFQEWNGRAEGRIKVWFAPFTELLSSPELLEKTSSLAEKHQTGIHMHLAESYETQSIIKRTYGKRIFEYLNDINILGPTLMGAHCCWLSENEIRLIRDTQTKVSYCPVAEMKLSDGVTPVSLLRSEGVTVSIGTDAVLCNNCGDLLREAKIGSLLQRVIMPPLDAARIPAEEAMRMITIDAAKCAQWEQEIGSIEKGKKADLVLIDIKKPHFFPLVQGPTPNILGNLIYAGSGNDVHTVIVNGKTVVKNRAVLTVTEDDVLEKFQEASENLFQRSGVLQPRGMS